MTDAAKETLFDILNKWGFPTLMALGLAWVLRVDFLIPMMDEHRSTVKELRDTQKEIAQAQKEIAGAINEQTRLLYALQPKVAGASQPESGRN